MSLAIRKVVSSLSKLRLRAWVYLLLFFITLLVVLPLNNLQASTKQQSFSQVYLPAILNSTFEQKNMFCNPSGGSGGFSPGTYDTIIEGQPTTIIVGAGYDSQRPTFLAFYLHGTEGNYKAHNDSGLPVAQFINENNWIYVAPQAPRWEDAPSDISAYPWLGPLPERDAAGNGQLLMNIFQHMADNYNICQNVLFGSGASGGSAFLDTYFIPFHAEDFPNTFLNINCGSGGISPTNRWLQNGWYAQLQNLSQIPGILDHHDLYYVIGTEDFIYESTMDAIATYSDLGFQNNAKIIPGAGHCEFSASYEAATYWENSRATLYVPDLIPQAIDDSFSVFTNSTANLLDVVNNDIDPNNRTLRIISVDGTPSGSVQIQGNRLAYTPVTNFTGTDMFSYTIETAGGIQATANVQVVIKPEIVVNTNVDELNNDGDCSLREALQAANTDSVVDQCPAGFQHDYITIPGGSFTLTLTGSGEDANQTGDLDILDGVSLTGAGADQTIIDANGNDRVIQILQNNVLVELTGITIQNGYAPSGAGLSIPINITNVVVNIRNSTIRNNQIQPGIFSTDGGGIDSGYAALTILNSTVSHNISSNYGGGIASQGPLTMTNTTIAYNQSALGGAGLYHKSQLGPAYINNATIAHNNVTTINSNIGAGVYAHDGSPAILTNSVIANNAPDNCGSLYSDRIRSQGYNVSNDDSCNLSWTGDTVVADARLGVFQNNGGETETFSILSDSPAFNLIPYGTNGCGTTLTVDQRYISRPQGWHCDAGSLEVQESG